MLKFVKNYLTKSKAKSQYDKKLKEFLADGVLDEGEKAELERIASEYGLESKDILEVQKRSASLLFDKISDDGIITEEERLALEDLTQHFGIKVTDFNFDQKTFNKFYTLGLIEKGILPHIEHHNLSIIFKKNEKLHWGIKGELRKYKTVTKKINYNGLSGSIKIMKGVRFKAGSMNVKTVKQEYVSTEDVGYFWITNQRIGFIGTRKNFTIPINKILTFQLNADGLLIFKEGRETPYLVALEDYEVVCSIFSFIINE